MTSENVLHKANEKTPKLSKINVYITLENNQRLIIVWEVFIQEKNGVISVRTASFHLPNSHNPLQLCVNLEYQ